MSLGTRLSCHSTVWCLEFTTANLLLFSHLQHVVHFLISSCCLIPCRQRFVQGIDAGDSERTPQRSPATVWGAAVQWTVGRGSWPEWRTRSHGTDLSDLTVHHHYTIAAFLPDDNCGCVSNPHLLKVFFLLGIELELVWEWDLIHMVELAWERDYACTPQTCVYMVVYYPTFIVFILSP